MEDEILSAEEQRPNPKQEELQNDEFFPAVKFRAEDPQSCCGTKAVRGGKLHVYDWLSDLPEPSNASDLVEVRFKNTRKGYYRNSTGITLKNGDIVAVESSPGHDIGEVTLQGRLVYLQMHKNHINPDTYEFKRVYRIARTTDLEKWEEAKALEHQTMLEARRIAQDLRLNMKIGDVEYQGDRTKAIFYYIADERVDFRELIKVLADRFRVRIEMRQIGARQEAGRIGGIGPCGREMCCASWMTSFISVSTHSARIQDLSLNPVKLAGQCGKLKCCLNFELSAYLDALKNFPPTDKPLETADGTFYFFKYDIFKHLMWYSPQKDSPTNIVAVEADHVAEIIKMNQEGKKPDTLGGRGHSVAAEDDGYSKVVELDDDLTRFDSKNSRNGRSQPRQNANRNRRDGRGNNQQGSNQRPRPMQQERNRPNPSAAANNAGQQNGSQNGRQNSQNLAQNNQQQRQQQNGGTDAGTQSSERMQPRQEQRDGRPMRRDNRQERTERPERQPRPGGHQRGSRPQQQQRPRANNNRQSDRQQQDRNRPNNNDNNG